MSAVHTSAVSFEAPITELDNKMDFWIKHNLNVLLEGQQGVGKSAVIEAMARRNGLNYKYYTASLIDPYLTLIGVPRAVEGEDGQTHLDFIKPQEFADDSVEFIFLDELNRAPAAVRNATMELIQFGSINGRKLRNLKAVWAAINPYDDNETFNVAELDPAQKDRFHVFYKMPFMPSTEYFTARYGQHMAEAAIKWWKKVPKDIRNDVSPRRLDYALQMHQIGGDITDVLMEESRPQALVAALRDFTGKEGSHMDRWMSDSEGYLEEIVDRENPTEVNVVEAFAELKKLSMDQAVDYCGRLLPEQLKQLIDSDTGEIDILLRNYNGPKNQTVESALRENEWQSQHVTYVLQSARDQVNKKFFKAYEDDDLDKMLDLADNGLEYAVAILWALRERKDDFPTEIIHRVYKEKGPKILKFLALASFSETAKLFDVPEVK